MIQPSWIRHPVADPIRHSWENRRERRLDDPFQIERALNAQPIGRPQWPAHGPRETFYLAIDGPRADRILAGDGFSIRTELGEGFPVSRSRGVEILPDAERELCIDVPAGMLDGARAFVYFGRIVVLLQAEDLFSSDVRISEARKIGGGAK